MRLWAFWDGSIKFWPPVSSLGEVPLVFFIHRQLMMPWIFMCTLHWRSFDNFLFFAPFRVGGEVAAGGGDGDVNVSHFQLAIAAPPIGEVSSLITCNAVDRIFGQCSAGLARWLVFVPRLQVSRPVIRTTNRQEGRRAAAPWNERPTAAYLQLELGGAVLSKVCDPIWIYTANCN